MRELEKVSIEGLVRRYLCATSGILYRWFWSIPVLFDRDVFDGVPVRQRREATAKTMDKIVWDAGYVDARAFRKRFAEEIGLTPKIHRKRFATREQATLAQIAKRLAMTHCSSLYEIAVDRVSRSALDCDRFLNVV